MIESHEDKLISIKQICEVDTTQIPQHEALKNALWLP